MAPLPGVTATKPGAVARPLPGIHGEVVDETGNPLLSERGFLVLKRPWPAMLRTLYKEDERYQQTYFGRFDERTYFVGDVARVDDDGYFWVQDRVDDMIRTAGFQFCTAEIESAIVAHPEVAEAAAIGQHDESTGQAVCAFVILQGDHPGSAQLEQEIRDQVTQRWTEAASPKRIVWTADLPKTRSGKIMRRLLHDIAEGRELGDLTTLRDPHVIDESSSSDSQPNARPPESLDLDPGRWAPA